jgi:hypothetical protein
VATLDSVPSQAPLWIGSDRLAYLDSGTLRIVDLNGSTSPVTLTVNGSVSAAPDGQALAAQTPSGPVLFSLATGSGTSLPDGATRFSWSAASDLAFVVDKPAEQDLWVMRHGGQPRAVQQTTTDRAWSGLSWAPDGSSLIFASLPAGGASGGARAFTINADGSALRAFGRSDLEYREPRWSPQGSTVSFIRSDEDGGIRLWLARVLPGQLSAADQAQADALAQVQAFMQARVRGDQTAAQAALGSDLKAAVQAGTLSLTPPGGSVFAREYVVSVQLVNNDRFQVGVRLVLAGAVNAQESSFFEEQLTVARHPAGFLVDSLTRGKPVKIGGGPTVISVEVQRSGRNVKVMVHFDADLDPSTVSAQTVQVLDGAGHALTPTAFSFDRDHRLVSITAPAQPGSYKLLVTSAVTDINGQAAQSYTAPIVVSSGS